MIGSWGVTARLVRAALPAAIALCAVAGSLTAMAAELAAQCEALPSTNSDSAIALKLFQAPYAIAPSSPMKIASYARLFHRTLQGAPTASVVVVTYAGLHDIAAVGLVTGGCLAAQARRALQAPGVAFSDAVREWNIAVSNHGEVLVVASEGEAESAAALVLTFAVGWVADYPEVPQADGVRVAAPSTALSGRIEFSSVHVEERRWHVTGRWSLGHDYQFGLWIERDGTLGNSFFARE